MSYRVVYTEPFLNAIDAHVDYLLGEGASPERIAGWYDKLFEHFDMLDVWPRMYPVDEPYSAEAGRTCHKVNYADYLVFYEVKDEERAVKLLAFFHGAMRK